MSPLVMTQDSITIVNTGLIFRVTAQNPGQQLSNPGSSNVSRLFVAGFRNSGVCFLGLVGDNAAARNLLDTNVECKRMLKIIQVNDKKKQNSIPRFGK